MRTLGEQLGQLAGGLLSSFESAHVSVDQLLMSVAPSAAALNAIASVQQMERQADERVTAIQASTARRARDRARLLGRRRTLRRLLDGETTDMGVWLHNQLLPMTAGELHAATPETLVTHRWPESAEASRRPDALTDATRALVVFRLLAHLAAAADLEYPTAAVAAAALAEQLTLAWLTGLVDELLVSSALARRHARPPGRLVSASPHVTRGPGRRRPRSLSRGSRRAVRAPRGAVAA